MLKTFETAFGLEIVIPSTDTGILLETFLIVKIDFKLSMYFGIVPVGFKIIIVVVCR